MRHCPLQTERWSRCVCPLQGSYDFWSSSGIWRFSGTWMHTLGSSLGLFFPSCSLLPIVIESMCVGVNPLVQKWVVIHGFGILSFQCKKVKKAWTDISGVSELMPAERKFFSISCLFHAPCTGRAHCAVLYLLHSHNGQDLSPSLHPLRQGD